MLVWLWIKFIQPAIVAAQQNKNKQIAEAERHRDEAKATLESLRTEIEGAQRDADLIRQRAEDQAKREAEAIVSEAREAGERSLRNAQRRTRSRPGCCEASSSATNWPKPLLRSRARRPKTRVDGGVNASLVRALRRIARTRWLN